MPEPPSGRNRPRFGRYNRCQALFGLAFGSLCQSRSGARLFAAQLQIPCNSCIAGHGSRTTTLIYHRNGVYREKPTTGHVFVARSVSLEIILTTPARDFEQCKSGG